MESSRIRASWIEERLPPIVPCELRCEADYYGASWLISAACGLRVPPRSFAAWVHGWYAFPVEFPQQISGWALPGDRHLVGIEEQARFLRDKGLPRVEAIGVPYVYVDDGPVERRPRSLLVMPPHSLPYTDHAWDSTDFARLVAEVGRDFETVVVCVSASCFERGFWVREFAEVGIPCIVGARIDDRNAMLRMSRIFRSFETMTTNVIGSHLAYAAYSGCRVSVHGPWLEQRWEDARDCPFHSAHPEIYRRYLSHITERAMRRRHGSFFVPPQGAIEARDWGARELGAENRRPAAEVARLLGWSIRDTVLGWLRLPVRRLRNAYLRRTGRRRWSQVEVEYRKALQDAGSEAPSQIRTGDR